MIVTTAGLSVDPDDVKRQGLLDAGCIDLVYGAPILPGAMILLARIGDITVIGVPACGLYHKTTSFDLLLPRILAGQTIGRNELAEMGHGGFCRDRSVCIYPQMHVRSLGGFTEGMEDAVSGVTRRKTYFATKSTMGLGGIHQASVFDPAVE